MFLTNGNTWKRQRRIIDPAFEGGRIKDVFPAIKQAADAMVERLEPGEVEIEEICSYAAADVIFRTLFSIPIEHQDAHQVFREFQNYQREQPLLNVGAFVKLPSWIPRNHSKVTRGSARKIRALITKMTHARHQDIKAGTAPDDLATRIMTTPDPKTGHVFETDEMVDQVAIFFLAGHETSASALAWALYLCALYPEWQDKIAAEAAVFEEENGFRVVSKLLISRDVFRETLRLYPPVPMMVRETTCPEKFRNRPIKKGAQIVMSPWHLHRNGRIWENPDAFDPTRWSTETGRDCARDAYIPFSAGSRVCPGAGFAMIEGPVLLSTLLRRYEVRCVPNKAPVPVAHITVRSRDGIYLELRPRG